MKWNRIDDKTGNLNSEGGRKVSVVSMVSRLQEGLASWAGTKGITSGEQRILFILCSCSWLCSNKICAKVGHRSLNYASIRDITLCSPLLLCIDCSSWLAVP